MLTMLFVNDFAGMSNIPHWMHHAAMDEDMLGFSDLVFPAFIFCVGMSIPFAIINRYSKGDSPLEVLLHIAKRTVALLIMGLFSMNLGGVEGGLSRQAFTLLAVACYFLVWNVYPKKNGRTPLWCNILKALGLAGLAALVIYKDLNGMPFKVGWWGILGLIAWTYLVCSLIFTFTKGRTKSIVIAWLVVVMLCILNSTKAIPANFSSRAIILGFIPGGWTHHALGMSGVLTSVLMLSFGKEKSKKLIGTLVALGIAMFLLGLLSHNFWIISKIQATPTWLFFCTAIFFPLFALIYWIADVKGKSGWSRPISPAGTATLTCYTVPYIWYAVQQTGGWHWPAALTSGGPGLLKALAFSFAVIGITWLLGKCRIKLKI